MKNLNLLKTIINTIILKILHPISEYSYQAEYLGENSRKWGGGSKSGKHQPPYTIENGQLMNSSSLIN